MIREVQAEHVATAELRQVCADLERRMGAGEACCAEEVFASHPELTDDADAALEVIYTEFVARERLGQKPAPDSFCSRFPAFRESLEQLFQIHRVAGGVSVIDPASPDGTPFPDAERLQVLAEAGLDGALRRVGNYEILGEIGRGGMGVVYKARQVGLNRLVALKMILTGADAGPSERARFRTEAEAAARLQHPNIVQIHEVGEHEGRPFLSLEYVDGGSLEDALTGTPWPAQDAARLVESLARAMHHAHQHGIVHRDLKPANVLLSAAGDRLSADVVHEKPAADGRQPTAAPKIADFGLARQAHPDAPTRAALTATGAIVGTPAYMAPEQAEGDAKIIGPATDVYALGAILYELLTGRPPFQGVRVLETLEQVRTQEPLPPSRLLPKLARDIETICLKCLRKEPGRRYENADALADDLGRFQRGEPVLARPTPAWERLWKWAKRRPAIAGSLVTIVILVVTALTTTTLLWRLAAEARRAEQKHREQAETILSARSIALARAAWLTDNLDLARQALSECPPELRNGEWRYLERVCFAEYARLIGHKQSVFLVAFSPDSQRLVSVGNNSEIKLWDVGQKRLLWEVKDKISAGQAVAFSPDGAEIILSGLSGQFRDPNIVTVVYGFEAVSGRELWQWKYDSRVEAVAFSSDRQHVVFADRAGSSLKVVEMRTGRVSVTIPLDPRYKVVRQAFSPDGRQVASAIIGGSLLIWDAKTGQPDKRIPFNSVDQCQVAFSPNGRTVVNAINERLRAARIVAFDVESGHEILRITTPVNQTDTLAFSPDGRFLVSAGNLDRQVFLWDTKTGQELLTFRGHPSGVHGIAYSPDGRFVATGGRDGTVRIWHTTLPDVSD